MSTLSSANPSPAFRSRDQLAPQNSGEGGKPALRRVLCQQRYRSLESQPNAILVAALSELPRQLQCLGRHGFLGLYSPLKNEPDLRSLSTQLEHHDCLCGMALPAVDQRDMLVYRRWRAGQPLGLDACGIPAPDAAAESLNAGSLAMLLVPGLAVDGEGYRLGSGNGYFDRLRKHPDWSEVPALVVLPASCRVNRLPRDPWDVPFDGWLSEDGLQWLQPVEHQQG